MDRVFGRMNFGKKAAIVLFLFITNFFAIPKTDVNADSYIPSGYWLTVNVATNTVTAYYNGSPIRAMVCSTGPATPTSGTYRMSNRYRWHALYHGVYGQYVSRITGHILFHSVPYRRNWNAASLRADWFDLLGTQASMGCVRLMTADAKWIYDNCKSTLVTFYWDTKEASPLGVPYAGRIFEHPSYNNWDPTDISAQNPWNHYLGTAFDADYYLAANPDLLQITTAWNAESLKLHWLTEGIKEGRMASPYFYIEYYKSVHPELVAEYGADNYAYVKHYNAVGEIGNTAEIIKLIPDVNEQPESEVPERQNTEMVMQVIE